MYPPFRASWQMAVKPSRMFPPPSLIIPYGGFSPVRLEASPSRGNLPPGFLRRLFSALAVHSVSGLTYPVFWNGGEPTGPWLSAVYHVRVCKRYYGLMRQSDGLPPAWRLAYSGGSLPSRAVRLTFPSLLCHTLRTCHDLYPAGGPTSLDGSSIEPGSLHRN